MNFVTPALLFGALLFAVPLIIHLLNRQRYKKREWAAMEFLLLAYKKQRRRLRSENLILLLLRCLIPILLAIAIARPVMRDIGIGGGSGAAHHVVVLDRSYSMGLRPGSGASPFERGRALIGQLLEALDGETGHRVTLVLGGPRPSVPVQEEMSLDRARAFAAALEGPLDGAETLRGALVEVAQLVEQAPETDMRVHVFTDMQLRAFGDALAAGSGDGGEDDTPPQQPPGEGDAGEPDPDRARFADRVDELLRRIDEPEHVAVTVVDVGATGGAREEDVAVLDLRLGVPQAVARVPVPVVVRVANRTASRRDVAVTLRKAGGEPVIRSIDLEAGAEGELEFRVTFRETGYQHLSASLEPDALDATDQRFIVVPVEERLSVLIVEGSTETDPQLSMSGHIARILDPTGGEGPPELTVFAPKVVDTIAFLTGRENLEGHDLVILADVERLTAEAADALSRAVQAGTGLMLMLGPAADPASYDLHLHRGGEGPLPLRLLAQRGFTPGGDRYLGSTIEVPAHPVFADLDEEVYREVLRQTPIYRVLGSDVPEGIADRVAVLMRVRDEWLSPLLVASSHGLGRVLVMTSPLDSPNDSDRWNRLDDLWIAFPLLHQACYWLTLPADDPYNVLVGEELTTSLRYRPTVTSVLLPERAGRQKVPVGDEPRPLPGERFSMPPFRRTDHAGLYVADLVVDHDGGAQEEQRLFAVNVDPDEGDLRYLALERAREHLGVDVVRSLPDSGDVDLDTDSSEIGPRLLYAVLLLLLSEAAWARLISRRRA